jgi:hypothetical protein
MRLRTVKIPRLKHRGGAHVTGESDILLKILSSNLNIDQETHSV